MTFSPVRAALKFLPSLTVLVLCAPLGARPAVDPNLPRYEPRPCAVPDNAPYRRPDGTILLVGDNGMRVAYNKWTELFTRTHPGFKFTGMLPGSSVGIGGLVYGLSPFALIGREIWPDEGIPFGMVYHRQPVGIRVGRGSYSKTGRTTPIAICVNPANPIDRLTTEQVARIVTVGGGHGDITTWGQLGLVGEWKRRPIHVMGVEPEGGPGIYLRFEKSEGYPMTPHYESLSSGQIMRRLAEEPSAIAVIGLEKVGPGAKVLAISETEGGYYSKGSYEDVLSGKYPYTRYIYFYINREPGKPLDPFMAEFVRMVLSKEGQEALSDEPEGMLPLSAADARAELAKLGL